MIASGASRKRTTPYLHTDRDALIAHGEQLFHGITEVLP